MLVPNLACRIIMDGSQAQPLICHVMSQSGSFAMVQSSLLGHGVTGICYNFVRYSIWKLIFTLLNL